MKKVLVIRVTLLLISLLLCGTFLSTLSANSITTESGTESGILSSPSPLTAPKIKAPVTESEENPRITDIQIRGNRNTASQIILLSMQSKIGDLLERDKVMEDIKTIYQLGFFQSPPMPQIEKHGPGVRLIFHVTENPLVEKIIITNNTLVPTETILEAMNTKPGTVLNIRQLYEDLSKISLLYREKGFIYSGIYNPANQVNIEGTSITIKVKESTINKIQIEGTKKTRDYVIMRELLMEEGQIFNRDQISDSFRNLKNLDYFEMEEPEIVLNPDTGNTDITLKFKEIKTGAASFGGGYSSINGMIGFVEATERNFRGKGQNVRIKTQFGGERAYELGFSEPYFQGRPQAVGGSIFRTIMDRDDIRDQQLYSRFEEKRDGFSVFSSWRKRKDETFTLQFTDEKVETMLITGNPSDLYNDHQQTISATWVLDKRDNFQDPRTGFRHSLTFATTGGLLAGKNNFNKYSYDFRKYWPSKFIKRNTIAVRNRIGYAQTLSGEIPYWDLWSVGGAQTLRGYEDREFVGKQMWHSNIELRYDLSSNIQGVIFTDFGSAWDTYGGFDLKSSYGIGIRFKTPLGPFRLDLGRGSDRNKNKFHFGIGATF
jgi:outer membrane protein insertion porin family